MAVRAHRGGGADHGDPDEEITRHLLGPDERIGGDVAGEDLREGDRGDRSHHRGKHHRFDPAKQPVEAQNEPTHPAYCAAAEIFWISSLPRRASDSLQVLRPTSKKGFRSGRVMLTPAARRSSSTLASRARRSSMVSLLPSAAALEKMVRRFSGRRCHCFSLNTKVLISIR